MVFQRKHSVLLLVLCILLPIAVWVHFVVGHISITYDDIVNALFHFDDQNTNQLVIREVRIPRIIIAILAGGGLAIAGLLMQTLFNNPLAGPYVLGINSGSSLFVALILMTGIPFLASGIGIIASALIGAFLFGLIILLFSLKVKSHISLLLVGLMLGSFTSALVYVLQSSSSSEQLKAYTMWAMGSLQHVQLHQIPVILLTFLIGILGAILLIKPLNVLVIGEENARLLGIRYKSTRLLIIIITALLTGLITAYCGPIAFVGLAVPNLVRIIFRTQNHVVLLSGCLLIGSLFILICDIIIQLLEGYIHLPINALTSLIGAPFVVYIVLKRLA